MVDHAERLESIIRRLREWTAGTAGMPKIPQDREFAKYVLKECDLRLSYYQTVKESSEESEAFLRLVEARDVRDLMRAGYNNEEEE